MDTIRKTADDFQRTRRSPETSRLSKDELAQQQLTKMRGRREVNLNNPEDAYTFLCNLVKPGTIINYREPGKKEVKTLKIVDVDDRPDKENVAIYFLDGRGHKVVPCLGLKGYLRTLRVQFVSASIV